MTDIASRIDEHASGHEIDVRTRVIMEAERLFRSIGYQKTTVADIAKMLKMSPANVYRFFDSKKAIHEAVAVRLMEELEHELEVVAHRPDPAAQRVKDFLITNYSLSAERFVGDIKLHEMVEIAISESWNAVEAHIERVGSLMQHIIEEGVASGEFTVADATVASQCVTTAWARFCHPQLIAQCADRLEPTPGQMADFILSALLTHRP